MSHRVGFRGGIFIAALALAITALVAGEHATCTKSAGECAARMKELYQTRGWMGVELEQNEDGTLRITSVVEGSPADRAGIRPDATLISVNGVALSKDATESVMMKGDDWRIGGLLALGVRRAGETSTIKVKLEKIPETVLARVIDTHIRESHPIAKN